MLKSISLKNYKCFRDEVSIDIAPLTVLCGVNSSGKSSILKGLLMLKQSYENNPNKGQVLFSGDYVDNGSFKDVVYNNEGNDFTITTSFLIEDPKYINYNKSIYKADKSNFSELNRIFKNVIDSKKTKVLNYNIEMLLIVEGDDKPQTQIQAIKNRFSKYNISITMNCADMSTFHSTISIIREESGLYSIEFCDFPLLSLDYDGICMTEIIGECHCYFDGLKIIKVFSTEPSVKYNMTDFLPNLYTIFSLLSEQYYNIKHISPLRYLQQRRYMLTSGIREMAPNGEDMLQMLAQYGTRPTTCFKLDVNDNFVSSKTTLIEASKWWSSYMQTGNLELIQKDELLKLNVSGHNIIDVGVGVGQSMPIVISGLYSSMNSVLMIEQPEIHLHPRAQMSMADFLLSLSLNEKKVIVETHSDHIINRLVRRIMQDKSGKLNRDIAIYFVDKDSDSSIEKIEISPTKGIVNAPKNFFTQFSLETMDISKIGFENHREGINWVCKE